MGTMMSSLIDEGEGPLGGFNKDKVTLTWFINNSSASVANNGVSNHDTIIQILFDVARSNEE